MKNKTVYVEKQQPILFHVLVRYNMPEIYKCISKHVVSKFTPKQILHIPKLKTTSVIKSKREHICSTSDHKRHIHLLIYFSCHLISF